MQAESPATTTTTIDPAVQFSLDPNTYAQWYQTLAPEQLSYYYTPEAYYQWYWYYHGASMQMQMQMQGNGYGYGQMPKPVAKKDKLSRNQKRKIKKKQLQQEYEKQKKQLGKWVTLQRKDLIQQLQHLQHQQQKIKQKRKQKLSHLIQIHKEVYKLMMKRNRGKVGVVGKGEHVGNFRKKKKKPSHIKRMKMLYEQVRNGGKVESKMEEKKMEVKSEEKVESKTQEKVEQQRQEDYITESQSQIQDQQQTKLTNSPSKNPNKPQPQQKQQKQHQQPPKSPQQITYTHHSKLTNTLYNNIPLRQWVDHLPSAKLQDLVLKFINKLAYKQAVKKVSQPEKARKSIIAGIHECKRTLWTKIDKKRSKLLIIALNIEKNIYERGTDDQIQQTLTYASQAKVPVIHSSTRSKIGRAFTGKFGPRITMVSVVNYEGFQDLMEEIMEEWGVLRSRYEEGNQGSFGG